MNLAALPDPVATASGSDTTCYAMGYIYRSSAAIDTKRARTQAANRCLAFHRC
jgi:hypothetical protein